MKPRGVTIKISGGPKGVSVGVRGAVRLAIVGLGGNVVEENYRQTRLDHYGQSIRLIDANAKKAKRK